VELEQYKIPNPSKAFANDGHPLTFAHYLFDWDSEWVLWDAETIRFEVKSRLNVEVSDAASDTILALQTMLVSEDPWKKPWAFEVVCRAITDPIVDWGTSYIPSPGQILFALRTMKKVDDRPFSEELEKEMAHWMVTHGIIWLSDEWVSLDEHLRPLFPAEQRDQVARFYRTESDKTLSDWDVDDDQLSQVAAARVALAIEYANEKEKYRG
jgi:hypothetical protein